ncbi:cell division protein SepF [Gordonia spumicola]|uniref:Cell division protein SepF n=1 Tax=Gordonia spumicola TaxID=589161 RepID=A0A7I9VDA5_9ACTN|nr:cell division protein SepF [Gordonia spumicola]GEE03329.1 cell division protein SepF [Gordonia spumicola]
MTTMQKFKAYFGMVPPNEYDDDYFDEPAEGPALNARERTYMEKYRSNSLREEPFYEEDEYRESEFRGEYRDAPYREPEYAGGRGYAPRSERPYIAARRAEAPRRLADEAPVRSRLEPLDRPSMQVRGANAIAPELRPDIDQVVDQAAKITTLRPADYSEARTIGERYRDGNPVIIDLADMSNDDAKRLVDFAAGLAFAVRGSLEKVATKVFLLSPAGIDVSPEQRRRIAETGYSSRS